MFGWIKKRQEKIRAKELTMFWAANARRLLNEDRIRNGERRLDDVNQLAFNFVLNEIVNTSLVWRKNKNIRNEASLFELSIIYYSSCKYSLIVLNNLGASFDESKNIATNIGNEILKIAFCNSINMDEKSEDLIRGSLIIKDCLASIYGDEKVTEKFDYVFKLSLSCLGDNKDYLGREQLHIIFQETENAVLEHLGKQLAMTTFK